MDAQLNLPMNFEKFVYDYIGEKVSVALTNNLFVTGTLLNVTADFVQVLETYRIRNVCNMPEVFSVIIHYKTEDSMEFFHYPISRLFERFKHFLGKEVEISRERNHKTKIIGKLNYIGKNYFVITNRYEKWIACVLLSDDTIVKQVW